MGLLKILKKTKEKEQEMRILILGLVTYTFINFFYNILY